MKLNILSAILSSISLATAHSWVHCTDHNNTGILQDMRDAAAETPYREVDPLMPWFANLCAGWPRAKQNPGDWVDESSNYLWDLGLAASKDDTHACHPNQRTSTYYLQEKDPKLAHHSAPAPMATSTPGGEIKLLFGGNGHSRGDFGGVVTGDAGRIAVYSTGDPEVEITDISEFIDENKVQENGFSEESFSWPDDKTVTSPPALRDKGNWMTLRLPECIAPGRHMMVWVWSFGGAPRFSTCFDVMIQ